MNSDRTQAYGRVIKALNDLADSKLHPEEQQIVREAADSLLFCEDMASDPAAELALGELYELTDRLVENDRMSSEATLRLTADIEACGPMASMV
ncbi:MAG: hypothetical protein H0U33_08490 [Solirubrobacterales bacterium]|nr:hypothetical protein [Solirubrobacterales bacterium]